MTTTPSNRQPVPSEVWDELLMSFAAKARPSAPEARFDAVSKTGEQENQTTIKWLKPTTKALNRLPWQETNLPDGRVPPKPEAAATLLWLLLNILDDNTIDPTAIIPTSRGGVAAEWHIGGVNLEIECDPDGSIEYNFAAPGSEEYEGPAGPDLSQLSQHVGMLPKRAN